MICQINPATTDTLLHGSYGGHLTMNKVVQFVSRWWFSFSMIIGRERRRIVEAEELFQDSV